MSEGLQVRERGELTAAEPQMTPGSVMLMVKAAMDRGITAESVEVIERLAALAERVDARQAERRYNAALAALQRDCRNVVATKDVDGKFRYAPFLDLWNAVRPAVERHGFTLEWSQEHLGDRIKSILTIRHLEGYKSDKTLTMRIGTNAPGTPAGAQFPVLDSQAETRCKRRLLMDALNIVVDAVTPAEDAGNGQLATAEETDALFQRLVALGGDQTAQKRFLTLAGVETWNEIPKSVMPILARLMSEKERAAAAKRGAQ